MRTGGSDGDDSTDDEGAPVESTPDLDEFHRLLCSASRRRVLSYLQEHPETGLEELSDVVAGWKAVDEDAVVGPLEHDELRVSLHHTDVPKLADCDVVAYDRERREVTLQPLPESLSDIVRRTRTYEDEVLDGGRDDAT